MHLGFPGGSDGKESSCSIRDLGSFPGLERYPGEGKEWQPTLVFFPREFHGQRSLAGTVHGVAESDKTETHTYTHTHCFFISINLKTKSN